jgi:HAD superfamily hydrolase (TIGR01490 family)
MSSIRRAALFDMDRTLVRKDTASLYTRYRRDVGQADWRDAARVGWWMLKYTLGIIDAPRVAAQALASFRGARETSLIDSCDQWFVDYVLPHVCESGREAVRRHRDRGEVTIVITGATRYAAVPLARELGIEHVVCTELEVDGSGCLTGNFCPPLCYGLGKTELAARLAAREGFCVAESTFYSDSITDLPLLERVRHPVVVNPDARLRRVAQRRNWPIELW